MRQLQEADTFLIQLEGCNKETSVIRWKMTLYTQWPILGFMFAAEIDFQMSHTSILVNVPTKPPKRFFPFSLISTQSILYEKYFTEEF